jgi:hypothetical protein
MVTLAAVVNNDSRITDPYFHLCEGLNFVSFETHCVRGNT